MNPENAREFSVKRSSAFDLYAWLVPVDVGHVGSSLLGPFR